MARSLKPTALYKSQRYQGPTITVNEGVSAPPIGGEILDVYWSIDLQGNNRTTTGDDVTPRYLIVKTKDIPDAVTLYLNSVELSTSDLVEGSLNGAVIIPLTVDGLGNGFGFYKILMDDDVGFKKSKWVDVTASRVFGTTYTNDTTAEIAICVEPAVGNYIDEVATAVVYVDAVLVARAAGTTSSSYQPEGGSSTTTVSVGEGTLYCIIPPGSTYRVVATRANGGGALTIKSTRWTELRPV